MQGLRRGPLGEHVHLYVEQLQRAGYSLERGHRFLNVVQDFAFWLGATGAGLGDVQAVLVSQYLAERRRHRPPRKAEARALSRPLPARDPREDLLKAYRLHLERKRGLTPISIASHLWFLRPFLQEIGIAI